MHRSLLAYLNALMDGAKLAFTIGLVLAVVNGATARFSPSKRTLDQIVSEKTMNLGGGN